MVDDPDSGAEGYTFDVTWGGAYGGNQPYGSADRSRPYGHDRGVFGDYSDTNTAIAGCQDAIRQEASRRYGLHNIAFQRERFQAEPGSTDTVRGLFWAMDNGDQAYRFSCAVNSNNDRVWNVSIEPADRACVELQLGRTPKSESLHSDSRTARLL